MKFLDLQAQYKSYKQEIDAKIADVISSGVFIGGQEIAGLEKDLANYCGAEHVVGCSSGTDALLLALMVAGVKPGDEVITTPFTFIATAEAPCYLGATLKFVDVDAKTYLIDEDKLEANITKKTKVILPVSLFGLPNNYKNINAIAEKYGLTVIEDAAQSFGAKDGENFSCNLSPLACTSFFPAKPLGCYGDGGAVFAKSEKDAARVRMLLNHGSSERYYHDEVGMNARLDALQAAVLRVKLKHFSSERQKRIGLANYYQKNLQHLDLTLPHIPINRVSVFAQYCPLAASEEHRNGLLEVLQKKNIPHAVYYPIPLHLQKAYAPLKYKEGDFLVTEDLAKRIFALPLHPFLTNKEQDEVIEAIGSFFKTIS